MIDNNKNRVQRYSKSERFVIDRQNYWLKLEGILRKIKGRGITSLTAEENREFPNLYRKICTDSELSKTLELSPDTQDYINKLLQHSHNTLYASPKRGFTQLAHFFNYDFPMAFFKNYIPILVIFLLFFGLGLLTFTVIYLNPDYAPYILSEDLIEHMVDSYSQDVTRSTYENIYMAGFYIRNNVSIAFSSFAAGVTYGLFTLYLIIYNAVIIGGVAGVVVSAGHGSSFASFVLAHSSLELLGICLAGGAGLSLGLSMIITTEERRGVRFVKKARELVPIILMAGFFITLAAFVEGFISPTRYGLPFPEEMVTAEREGLFRTIGWVIKGTIALVSALFMILYSYKILFLKIYKKLKFRKGKVIK